MGIELLGTVDPVDEFSVQRLKEFDSRELKPTFVADHIDEHPVRWMKESDGRARRPSSRPCPRWALRSRAWWILSMRFERSSGRTSTARSASRPSLRTQSTSIPCSREDGRRNEAESTFFEALLMKGIEAWCTVDPVDEVSVQR